ncbi:hypothetical protein EDB19DRAFT_525835 [Suillus lakei]|nr:hypothetical protein EDB19DRAFT_525835 [Suillus lakei]
MPKIVLASRQTVAEQIDVHQPSTDDEPSDWQIGLMLGRNSSRQTLLQLQYSDPAPAGPRGQKRSAEESVAPVTVKHRAQRTCKKCHRTDCPGSFRSRPCVHRQSNVSSQQTLNAPQHASTMSAGQLQRGLSNSVSVPSMQARSTHTVPHTTNMPHVYFHPQTAFFTVPNPLAVHHMSDGTVRTSFNAQSSSSGLSGGGQEDLPASLTNMTPTSKDSTEDQDRM